MTAKRRGPASTKPALAAGANVPQKPYRTTHMTLGLVAIEVSFYSAVGEPGTLRQTFIKAEDGTYHPVGKRDYDKVTGENIEDPSLIVKGVQTEDGVIEVTDAELAMQTEKTCEILGFIEFDALPLETRRLVCPHKMYQVRPASVKGHRNRYAEEALLLTLNAMREENLHCVLKVVMNNGDPERIAIMDSGGHMQLLTHQDYVREEMDLGEIQVDEAKQKMMTRLVTSKKLKQLPANPDHSAMHLARILETKETGGTVAAPNQPQLSATVPAIDLMALLEQEMKRK
jgi:non-homologous end joining protein Ku